MKIEGDNFTQWRYSWVTFDVHRWWFPHSKVTERSVTFVRIGFALRIERRAAGATIIPQITLYRKRPKPMKIER